MGAKQRASTFGRYRLQRELGRGGMAVVYLATLEGEDGFTKTVALKVLDRNQAAEDSLLAALKREALITGQFRHPDIVDVFDLGQVVG